MAKNFKQSHALCKQTGLKHRLRNTLYHKLIFSYGIEHEFYHPEGYYSLERDSYGKWWVIANKGCCWDGASWYFDWEWMLYPSLIHDILHWLIKRGQISTSYNDLIDAELQAIIMQSANIPWWQGGNATKKVRAYIIRKATNMVDEKKKKGTDTKVKCIDIRGSR